MYPRYIIIHQYKLILRLLLQRLILPHYPRFLNLLYYLLPLISNLYQPGAIKNLLAEDPEVAEVRAQTRARVDALSAAALTMAEFKTKLAV